MSTHSQQKSLRTYCTQNDHGCSVTVQPPHLTEAQPQQSKTCTLYVTSIGYNIVVLAKLDPCPPSGRATL
jgi:hypothetical protein